MSKKTYWIIGVIVAFLVVGVLVKKKFSKNSIEIFTESIQNRNITETVSANGKIQPEKEVKVSSEVPGEIVSLFIREGSVVSQGDLLIEINPDILTSSVDRMEAALNSSRANLSNSKARLAQSKARHKQSKIEFDRKGKLKTEGAISQSELDQAVSTFEVAKAEVEAANESVKSAEYTVRSSEASLKEAKNNLGRTKIYTPISGTVYSLNVEEGEKVVGTAQMAGTDMLRIANLNNMEVSVEVSENDIVTVSNGDSVDIEVDAYLDRKFKGIVTEISNSANNSMGTTEQVTSFNVLIRLLRSSYLDLLANKDSTYSPFRPGMSAAVEIKTKSSVGVISVTIQSVTLRPDSFPRGVPLSSMDRDEMKECVFVLENNKVNRVFVKTGIQDENYIQILFPEISGVVVKGPYSTIARKLRNNDNVEVKLENDFKMTND